MKPGTKPITSVDLFPGSPANVDYLHPSTLFTTQISEKHPNPKNLPALTSYCSKKLGHLGDNVSQGMIRRIQAFTKACHFEAYRYDAQMRLYLSTSDLHN